jgi:hypothetical protein
VRKPAEIDLRLAGANEILCLSLEDCPISVGEKRAAFARGGAFLFTYELSIFVMAAFHVSFRPMWQSMTRKTARRKLGKVSLLSRLAEYLTRLL